MKLVHNSILATVVVLFAALPALADDRALVIGNSAYPGSAAVPGAADALQAVPALQAAGFRVLSGRDLTAAQMRDLLSGMIEGSADPGRIVILMSGQFARSAQGTWMLGTEATAPDLATVGKAGLDLATVLEIASAAPGGAVVVLGTEDRRIGLGAGLASGMGLLRVPQGVTVIRGEARDVADFVRSDLLTPGASLAELSAARPDLSAEGFLSALTPFITGTPDLPPRPVDQGDTQAERAAWEAARAADTPAAYEAYLTAWPRGANAPAARTALERLRNDPMRMAQATEDALALTRDQRREIQRALTLLGFNTRGIDGIFGPGTRAAIASWQRANEPVETGYLTRTQVTRLSAQADRRAAELEAEARARQAEQDRQDRAYWDETGARSDEAGLRAYLKRHPDGLFADVAKSRLAAIERTQRDAAAARDRAAWEQAERANTVPAYRAYLTEFPKGAFVATAEARIADLTGRLSDAEMKAARDGEAALNLNGFTRNLIESRLAAAGLDPGPVDGTFDAETRRAIRRFQRTRDLPVTGYVNEQTVVRLMADALRGGN